MGKAKDTYNGPKVSKSQALFRAFLRTHVNDISGEKTID